MNSPKNACEKATIKKIIAVRKKSYVYTQEIDRARWKRNLTVPFFHSLLRYGFRDPKTLCDAFMGFYSYCYNFDPSTNLFPQPTLSWHKILRVR